MPSILWAPCSPPDKTGDLVGNEAWSESAHIWVNTPPIAVISSPLDGWNYSESDIISIRSVGSRDPDGGQLNFTWSVSINGSIQFTETGEEFDIQFEPGEYVIKLLVEDADGDIDTTSVLILVLPLPPPRIRETDNPSLIIILLLILFIIVSLVLVFYLRTRQALEE